MDIQDIIRAIDSLQYRITNHADEEAQADRLKFDEILDSVLISPLEETREERTEGSSQK